MDGGILCLLVGHHALLRRAGCCANAERTEGATLARSTCPARKKYKRKLVAFLEAEGELSLNQLARRVGVSYQNLRPKITALQEKGIVNLDVTHKPKANTQLTTVATLALPPADIEAEIDRLKGEADGSEDSSGPRPTSRRYVAAAKHAEILRLLLDEGVPLAAADLTKRVNTSISLLRTLERRGFCSYHTCTSRS